MDQSPSVFNSNYVYHHPSWPGTAALRLVMILHSIITFSEQLFREPTISEQKEGGSSLNYMLVYIVEAQEEE